MTEIWKEIPETNGWYMASSEGRIRSLPRTYKNKKGETRKIDGTIRAATVSKNGYRQLQINVGGFQKTVRVCRMIALSFIPNPENKPFVNHKNGIKTDDRVENLEWCTAKENTVHAFLNGLNFNHKGEKAHNSKLTEEQARKIKYESEGVSGTKLAKIYGMHYSTIYYIKSGKLWKNI